MAATTCTQGETGIVTMDVHFITAQDEPIFSIALLNESGNVAFSTNTDAQHMTTGHFDAGSETTIKLTFGNFLSPGRYRLFATVARAGFGADVLDANHSSSIIVLPDRPGGGLTDLPHTLKIERSDV